MAVLPDDHEDKWEYQAHTRAKHNVLQYYLDVWTKIVSGERHKLRVFDCFAGRGDYLDSDGTEPISLENIDSPVDYPGSPQVVLDVLSQYSHLFKEAECFFLEPNDNNRADLSSSLSNTKGIPNNVNPTVVDGTFAGKTQDLIQESGDREGFAFFFMDPFGLKDLDYEVVTDVCGTEGFDSLITLMTKELVRWPDSEKHQESFTTLFGTDDWKDELENFEADELHNKEAEYYCQRLRKNGPEYTLAYMTTRGDTRALMYHLVFTTNDETGLEKMRESMMRCGTPHTLAYAPQRSEIQGWQSQLNSGGVLSEEDAAKSFLLTRFSGETLTFDKVAKRTSVERTRAESLRKHYRQYLIDLDNGDDVNIPQRENPDDPLKPDYEIEFPEQDE